MARPPITFTGRRTIAGKTVADFSMIMDPQRWQENVPLLWKRSRLIDGDGLSPERETDPGVIDAIQPGWKDRLFFEVVVVPFISTQRNVLTTSFSSSAQRIAFEYSQYECLTSIFLGEKAEGGIDVDEGGALCEQVGDQVNLTISKKVRFTQPSDHLPLVNLFGEVAVKLVLELLLIGVDL